MNRLLTVFLGPLFGALTANLMQPELGTLWFPCHCVNLLRQHPSVPKSSLPACRKAGLAALKLPYQETGAKKSHLACLALMLAA